MLLGSSAMPTAERAVLADRFAEDLDHQIAEAIDDLWLIGESGRRVHHPEDFTILFTLSRLPSVARTVARRFNPVERAAW
jgi:hypothetical protein